MSTLSKITKEYPVYTGVAAVLVGFLGYRLINRLRGSNIPQVPPITPPGATPNPSQKYSFGAQQYSDFAKSLFNAMDGGGTSEEKISQIFAKMKTYQDVLALIDSYGTRKLGTGYGWDSSPMTLAESLEYELNDSDMNVYVNTPLKRTGYKF